MSADKEQEPVSIEVLKQHLEEVKKLQPESRSGAKAPGDAARGAIDFATASAVGTAIGYGFDRWLDSLPWGLLIGLVIGTAAGLKLLLQEEARNARRSQKQDETKTDEGTHIGR